MSSDIAQERTVSTSAEARHRCDELALDMQVGEFLQNDEVPSLLHLHETLFCETL